MNSQNLGNGLTVATILQGFDVWITQHATALSVTIMFFSCVGGLIFQYLNWKQREKMRKASE